MKKQSGFTLIELLLVLAIIGIISAIAIPAMLSQRSRARDKASISNMEGRVGDLVGQYDKLKESGIANTAITTALGSYLVNTSKGDKNPWNTAGVPFTATVAVQTAATSKSTFEAALAAATLGEATLAIQYATSTLPGFVGGAVKVQNTINNATIVKKSTAIE